MTKAVVLRSKPKVADVRQWVVALGVLTAGNMTRVEAEMKLRAYVPLLQDEFPPAAFCQDSLAAVARECQWFPSYAEVARHLSAWWRANRPPLPKLDPPPAPEPRQPPTAEERAAVAELVARVTRSLSVAAAAKGERTLTLEPNRLRPSFLDPVTLDRLNPLPNGRKRADADFSPSTASEAGWPDEATEAPAG